MNARATSAEQEEALRHLFVDSEEDFAEQMYRALGASGSAGALQVAWGASCAVVTFLREMGGPRLVDAYLRCLDRLAKAELDVIQRHDLQADAP